MTSLNPHATLRQRQEPLRDRKYLDYLREQPCLVTGRHGDVSETVDPAHLRWMTDGGTSSKPSDFYVSPLIHSEHMLQHGMGETAYWLKVVNDNPQILCEFMKDADKWRYKEWKEAS